MYNPYGQTQVYDQQPPKKSPTKIIIIVVAVVLVVILCCCIVAAAIIFLDPFQWDLLGRITGKTDMAAQAMPEDTPLYMGINLVNFNPDKVNKIIKPFLEASGEFDENDTQGLINKLDETLDDEIGMTITDDVMPWIGQFVGIGFADLTVDSYYGGIQDASFVIIAEARDKNKADDFIQKLINTIEDQNGENFSDEEYEGVTIYTMEDEYSSVSICRSGSLVLLGTPKGSVKDAIDAQKGNNLKKNANFKNMASQLPGSRGVTLYVNGDEAKNILSDLTYEMGTAGDQMLNQSSMEAWQDSAISLSLVDAGIQIDVATSYKADALSETDKQLLSSEGGIPDSVKKLPSDTILYIAGQQLNMVWETYRDTIFNATGDMGDYEESMSLLEDQIGIHLEDDLLTYLDKDWAIAVIPESGGILEQSEGLPIGAVGLFGTSDQAALETTIGNFSEFLQSQGMAPDNLSAGDFQLYQIQNPITNSTIFAYGVGMKYLTIGTSGQVLTDIFDGTSPLGKDSGHSNVWKNFENNTTPVFYVNVDGVIQLIKSNLDEYSMQDFNDVEPYLEPVTYIAAGTAPFENNTTHSTIIIFIDQK